MEALIEEYLFQYKHCPLPSIGSLQLKEESAVAWHGDNKLSAPAPKIELTNIEIPAEPFTRFIAERMNITKGEASLHLESYCQELKKLNAYKEMKLEHAGRFHIDQYGKLVFKQEVLPKEFLPTVPIQLVTHAKATSHNIRVGDNVTTSEVMTEFYSDKGTVKKERWWIAAVILAAVAGASLYFYFKDHKVGDNFGNVQPVTTSPVEKTYRSE